MPFPKMYSPLIVRGIRYRTDSFLLPMKSRKQQQGPKAQGKNAQKRPVERNQSVLKSAPTAQARVRKSADPVMKMVNGRGDCRIIHREYIQDIVAQAAAPSLFNVSSFPINPGQAATFPWLAALASRYESYRFRSLRFCYESEAPTSLGGSVIISLDYDSQDPAPLTKQQAMAYRNAVRSAPWEEVSHVSSQEDLNKQKSYFVRPGAQPAGTDSRLYDTGNAFVATQNITTASAVCGELYVEYDVDLMTPVLENISTSGYLYSNSAALTAAAPMIVTINGSGALALSVDATNTIVTVVGTTVGSEYMFEYILQGTVITAQAAALTSGSTAWTTFFSGINAAATGSSNVRTIKATASTMTFTLSATATTLTQSLFSIAQVPISAA